MWNGMSVHWKALLLLKLWLDINTTNLFCLRNWLKSQNSSMLWGRLPVMRITNQIPIHKNREEFLICEVIWKMVHRFHKVWILYNIILHREKWENNFFRLVSKSLGILNFCPLVYYKNNKKSSLKRNSPLTLQKHLVFALEKILDHMWQI